MSQKFLDSLARKVDFETRADCLLRRINYTKKIRINGTVIRVPSINGVRCKKSEPWMTDLLAATLPLRPGAFLDVGVNVGQTLVKVKALDPNREYIGFEPNPVCVAYVQDLIKANRFLNCLLLPVGLFTHDGVLALEFFADDATDSSASLISNFRPSKRVQTKVFVPVFLFNNLAALGDRPVGLVKIDVEGAELEVVKSLSDVVRRDKPTFLIEMLPVYSYENDFRRGRQEQLEKLFMDADYAMLRVEKTPDGAYAGLKIVERVGIHSDLHRCDYMVLPREQLASVQFMAR